MVAKDAHGLCVLLAAPRSGTTVLGDTLSAAFGAEWLQEIFHEDFVDPSVDFRNSEDVFKKGSFFNFRYDLYKSYPSFSLPSLENQKLLFSLYIKSLKELFPDKLLIADV